MTMDFYVIVSIAGLVVGMIGFSLVIMVQHRLAKWLQERIRENDATIKDLQDRLMAKNLDNYKLWKQPVTAAPDKPLEEPIDDSGVGMITGREEVINA